MIMVIVMIGNVLLTIITIIILFLFLFLFLFSFITVKPFPCTSGVYGMGDSYRHAVSSHGMLITHI